MNFHGFLNNLSEEFEEGTITVSNTLSWGDELVQFSKDSGLDTGLGLQESIFSGKFLLDDGSAVFNDSKDRFIFSL